MLMFLLHVFIPKSQQVEQNTELLNVELNCSTSKLQLSTAGLCISCLITVNKDGFLSKPTDHLY